MAVLQLHHWCSTNFATLGIPNNTTTTSFQPPLEYTHRMTS